MPETVKTYWDEPKDASGAIVADGAMADGTPTSTVAALMYVHDVRVGLRPDNTPYFSVILSDTKNVDLKDPAQVSASTVTVFLSPRVKEGESKSEKAKQEWEAIGEALEKAKAANKLPLIAFHRIVNRFSGRAISGCWHTLKARGGYNASSFTLEGAA